MTPPHDTVRLLVAGLDLRISGARTETLLHLELVQLYGLALLLGHRFLTMSTPGVELTLEGRHVLAFDIGTEVCERRTGMGVRRDHHVPLAEVLVSSFDRLRTHTDPQNLRLAILSESSLTPIVRLVKQRIANRCDEHAVSRPHELVSPKNSTALPDTILAVSSAGTPSNIAPIAAPESGQVPTLCGKSLDHMARSTPTS